MLVNTKVDDHLPYIPLCYSDLSVILVGPRLEISHAYAAIIEIPGVVIGLYALKPSEVFRHCESSIQKRPVL